MSDFVDKDAFKAALRCWASGVTVITSRHGERIHGMTVSAFSSVSADPPLVLVCANGESNTNEVIWSGRVFAVNVLAREQEELSNRFAWGDTDTRFEGLEWDEGPTRSPLLRGAMCHLDCRVRSAHQEGTHVIYIGEVVHSDVRPMAEPLLYYAGAYRGLIGEEL